MQFTMMEVTGKTHMEDTLLHPEFWLDMQQLLDLIMFGMLEQPLSMMSTLLDALLHTTPRPGDGTTWHPKDLPLEMELMEMKDKSMQSTSSKKEEMLTRTELLLEDNSIGMELNTSDLLHTCLPVLTPMNKSEEESTLMKVEHLTLETKSLLSTELVPFGILKRPTINSMLEESSQRTSTDNASETLLLSLPLEEPSLDSEVDVTELYGIFLQTEIGSM
jgi:hypothetical protein